MSDILRRPSFLSSRMALACCVLAAGCVLLAARAAEAESSTADLIEHTQPKIVKIYGVGGLAGMEAYQSGLLISPHGHILTAFSYVLDTEYISVTLNDGQKFDAKLLGADPRLEIAVLKIDAAELPYFELAEAGEVGAGTRVLAFSNCYGVATGNEPVSVQHGVVSVKADLAAKRGIFHTPYHGPVYVIDAITNNRGSAGGALVTRDGKCVALLGKELRNSANNTWLNYAIPTAELRGSVDAILQGKFVAQVEGRQENKPAQSLKLAAVGVLLVPDILQRTPPYVDQIRPGSPADRAGIAPDDLIVLLDGRLIQSCKILAAELEYVDFEDPIRLTVLRDGQLLEFVLRDDSGDDGELP